MRIVYLSQRVPFPPDRGDKIITYNTLRYLSKRHTISVFCLADSPEDLENVPGLAEMVDSVEVIKHNGTLAKVRALRSLVFGAPMTLGYFNEARLSRVLREHIDIHGADLILVFSSGMAHFAQPYSHIPRVIQFGDLDSQKWAQYARTAGFPMSAVYGLEGQRLLRFERQIADTFSHSIVCTTQELKDFRRLIGSGKVSCVANGVDLDHFQPRPMSKKPASLIFTGVMDYLPNIDAMCWFCESILPKIQAQIPDATLTICGSRPTIKVQRLADLPGVTITGRVPDVVPYLLEAEVAVVPLRMGRGIQNKLLEAMAAGLPCVATRKAFEGLDAKEGDDLLVADAEDAFADMVVGLLHDGGRREYLGRQARGAMEKNYRWEKQLTQLERIIENQVAP